VNGTTNNINRGGGDTLSIVPAIVEGLSTSPAKNATQTYALFTDGLGKVTTYTLDGTGNQTKLQTPDGATQSYQLNTAGQVLVYTDALGRVTHYNYSTAGNLTGITYPDGSQATYQYDSTYNVVTSIQDTRGNLTTLTYLADDLVAIRDALNNITALAWSAGLLH